MDWISDPQAWIGFATLTVLEIVLGIDNIDFHRHPGRPVPPDSRSGADARAVLAMVTRVRLLLSIAWIIGSPTALQLVGHATLRPRPDPHLGGLFLLAKSTMEIHERLEGGTRARTSTVEHARLGLASWSPDHAARHRVFARLGDHRGRAWSTSRGHDRGGGGRDGLHAVLLEAISDFVDRHPP